LAIFLLFFPNAKAAVYNIQATSTDSAHAAQVLHNYQVKIESLLQIEYPDTVTVIIAYNQASFNRALSSEFPDWGAAAAVKERHLIVIKSPSSFPVGKGLEELLGHELGHLMLDKAAGGRWLPRWFEEGFCQMVSGEWRIEQDILVTRAVWGGGLIPLTALENVNRFGDAKASLAYAQSYLAVTSLVQEFGVEFFGDFFVNYNEENNFYDAFFNATGYRYIEWTGLWQTKAAQRFRFILYIFDPGILFPLIAVLFILLYLLKVYYSRQKMKQWEMEEKYRGDGKSDPT
jgi:hypothetical protein